MYSAVINVFVFLLGICAGSFLNCVIYRLENKKKMTGRSFCPKCKKQLKWLDIIPVLSFLFLKGKCRYCRKKISLQYPSVELFTGVLFVLIFWSLGFDWALEFGDWDLIKICFFLLISCFLIIIFVYDLKHYIIPDKVLFPAIAITIFYRLFEFLNFKLISNFKFQISNFILAALIASGFFLFIFLMSRGRWMGFGDVKLAVLMGLIFGFPNVLVALFLAFFLGAAVSVFLIILKKKGLKSEIPFGPFLIAGTFLAMFWGKEIIKWYFSF